MSLDQRRTAPAAARNRDAILSVLSRVLPSSGAVLEMASGTGQHAVHCAAALPGLQWQPTDPDPNAIESIAAWRIHSSLDNLLEPLQLDVCTVEWPAAANGPFNAVVCINMIHIAPWEAAEALFAVAAKRLVAGGLLYLYGPFKRDGEHTAPSNAAFDRQLRSTDRRWGLRDLEAVVALGADVGLHLAEIVPMPANNLSLLFRLGAASA